MSRLEILIAIGLTAGCIAMGAPALACRLPPTPEVVAAAYERDFANANLVVVARLSGGAPVNTDRDTLNLLEVRALRGAAAAQMEVPAFNMIGGEIYTTDCRPNYRDDVIRLTSDRIVLLFVGGEPRSIHDANSGFGLSVIERLEGASE